MATIPRTIEVLHEIAVERQRQVEAEGYSTAHDDAHLGAELAQSAATHACLAAAQSNPPLGTGEILRTYGRELWPFEDGPGDEKPARRHLVIAAALIVAEIERLDRAKAEGT